MMYEYKGMYKELFIISYNMFLFIISYNIYVVYLNREKLRKTDIAYILRYYITK